MSDNIDGQKASEIWHSLKRSTAKLLFPGDTALNWFLGIVLLLLPGLVERIIAYGDFLPFLELRAIGLGFLLFAAWQTAVIVRDALNAVNLTIASFLAFIPDAGLAWGIVSLDPPLRPLFRVLLWVAVAYMVVLGVWYAVLAYRELAEAEESRAGVEQVRAGVEQMRAGVEQMRAPERTERNDSAQVLVPFPGTETSSEWRRAVQELHQDSAGGDDDDPEEIVSEWQAGPGAVGGLILGIITAPSDRAEIIAKRLVDERLAACAQVPGEMTSFFWWENSVRRERERMVFLKTREDLVPQIERVLKDIHPYEVPEFIQIPITGGLSAYLAWMNSEMRPGDTLP